MLSPEHEVVLLGSRSTRAQYHPPPREMEVEPSHSFTSNYQAPQQQYQQYQHQPAPFATGNTPAARAAWVGYPFGSSAQMPPGGWPSPTPQSPYNPNIPPFSGFRTPPVMLSELGKLKEMCLELAYHSALSFAMVYKREKTKPFFTDADEEKFGDIMRKLYDIIVACYNADVLEDGNYQIMPHIRHKLELAFKWVDMYIVNLENLENPRWSADDLEHHANVALAQSPYSDEVLKDQVAQLPFFQLLQEVFPQFQNATNRKNFKSEGSMAAAAFARGGRGVRHKPKRHYKLTRRHKPKRHYKLTRRRKPKRHYKLTRRRKP
jgi:hypothetical protein